jgi:hypothetical protein
VNVSEWPERSSQIPEQAEPGDGSVTDEYLRVCRAVAGLDDVRQNLHLEIESLRARLEPILDLTSRPVLAEDPSRPEIGYGPTSAHAGDLRGLSASIEEITGAYRNELRDLVWIRERVGL